jgi:hypothetical protein
MDVYEAGAQTGLATPGTKPQFFVSEKKREVFIGCPLGGIVGAA